MHDDENVDISDIRKIQKKYQDPNLYCQTDRKEARKEKI